MYLIKTDSAGNYKWQKTYGGLDVDVGYSIQITRDNGYIIVGSTYSFDSTGSSDVYLIKTDGSGYLQWQKNLGEGLYSEEYGYSVKNCADNGFVIAGTKQQNVYLIKTDSLGNLQWENIFGADEFDQGKCVEPTTDGGYIIAGYTYSFGAGNEDVYVIKTDANGNAK